MTKQVKIKSIYRSFFSPLNNRSCQYQKHLNPIGKHSNYDLITANWIIRHFVVFIVVEELGSSWFQLESHGQKGLMIIEMSLGWQKASQFFFSWIQYLEFDFLPTSLIRKLRIITWLFPTKFYAYLPSIFLKINTPLVTTDQKITGSNPGFIVGMIPSYKNSMVCMGGVFMFLVFVMPCADIGGDSCTFLTKYLKTLLCNTFTNKTHDQDALALLRLVHCKTAIQFHNQEHSFVSL